MIERQKRPKIIVGVIAVGIGIWAWLIQEEGRHKRQVQALYEEFYANGVKPPNDDPEIKALQDFAERLWEIANDKDRD